ncbi:MAG: hypothetical protein LBM75_05385 [Myxococcales bacterium]|jgi:hypothetical protein|nr:hypothetical protein [Myxococcales bacterium]
MQSTKILSMSLLTCLSLCAACSESKSACSADPMDIERKRAELCQSRACGDVVFADACHMTHTKSCGGCLSAQSCSSQGICVECLGKDQCPNGHVCGATHSCVKHEDYCENTADCAAKGGGICTGNLCVSVDVSCGSEASCDAANDERCISGTCKRIIPLTGCSATGSTTLASTVVQAIEAFDGPEEIYEYRAQEEDDVWISLVPERSFDPAVYVLSRLSPSPTVLPAGAGEATASDEEANGVPEYLLFHVEAGATYYIVVTSNSSKQDGRYSEGHYSICMEATLSCTESCEE